MKLATSNAQVKILIAAVALVVLAYVIAFHSHPWGDPSAWGSLGDYFGGLLNPVVGIITVILVRETLRTTREEAESSRIELKNQTAQLEQQVRHAQGEARLNDIKRRLDGVLEEWEQEMAQPVGEIYVLEDYGKIWVDNLSRVTVRNYLTRIVNPATFENLKSVEGAGRLTESWNIRFENCLHLLDEISTYIEEYEQLAPGSPTAKYYARRVQLPLRVFRAVGIVGPNELHNLNAGLKQRLYSY